MDVFSFSSAEQSGGCGRCEGEVAGELWEGMSNSHIDCWNTLPRLSTVSAWSHWGIPISGASSPCSHRGGFSADLGHSRTGALPQRHPCLLQGCPRWVWCPAGMGETARSASLQQGNASASSLPALLLLYDITSKMSFDNIRVSPFCGLGACFSPGIGLVGALFGLLGVWGSLKPGLHVRALCCGQTQPARSYFLGCLAGCCMAGC